MGEENTISAELLKFKEANRRKLRLIDAVPRYGGNINRDCELLLIVARNPARNYYDTSKKERLFPFVELVITDGVKSTH